MEELITTSFFKCNWLGSFFLSYYFLIGFGAFSWDTFSRSHFSLDDTDDKCQHLEKRNNPKYSGLGSLKARLLMLAPAPTMLPVYPRIHFDQAINFLKYALE